MTATKGLGTTGNAVGVVTPLDMKAAQAGLIAKTTTPNLIRPGIFYSGNASLVTGTAGMAYSVAAYTLATQRSATSGVVLGGNDGALSVATTAAPGSNSRYDVIYHWHREYSLDGVDSNPVIGVVQGTAAASPTVPSLAAFPGAVELARILVPAGVVATNSGTTITQTAPFTSVDSSPVAFRTTTEMNLWTTAIPGQRATDLSSGVIYRWNGSGWKPGDITPWVAFTPVWTGTTGATSSTTFVWRYVGESVEFELRRVAGGGDTVSATHTFSLPVPMNARVLSSEDIGGKGSVTISSTAYALSAIAISTTTARMVAKNVAATFEKADGVAYGGGGVTPAALVTGTEVYTVKGSYPI